MKDLIDPLEKQINEQQQQQQQQHFGEGEIASVSVAERAMEEVAVKVESVPEILLTDLIDPLERQINEQQQQQQQQHFGEGERVSEAERAMEDVAVKVESVPVAVQAMAKVAAKGTADTSKQASQTKGATENYLKRSASPLPNERTRSKRIKSASSSMVVSDKGSVRVPQESIKQRSDFMFDQRFKELEEFKAEFGHCNVPTPHSFLSTKKNAPLGDWCGQMRASYKAFNEGRNYN